jgi:hypothetical protein
MAKQRHEDTQASSTKTPLLIMGVGVVLVAAMVVWALTRTVEQPTPSVASDSSAAAPTVPPVTTAAVPSEPTRVPSQVPSTTLPMTTSTGTTPPVDVEAQKAAIPRISAEDLREKMKDGSVIVVDVRDAASFSSGHIAGALHIPLASIEANLDLFQGGKDIVTYCT